MSADWIFKIILECDECGRNFDFDVYGSEETAVDAIADAENSAAEDGWTIPTSQDFQHLCRECTRTLESDE